MNLEGYLRNVIFESKENNYQIVSFYDEINNEDIVICGYFQPLVHDVKYELEGDYTTHPKHGKQFNVLTVVKKIDNSFQGIVDYLSSNFFPGVGAKYATEIFNKLGSDCLDLIVEDKTVLDKTNLPIKIKDVLYTNLIQNKCLEELFVKMYNSGLTSKNIMKLYEKYQDRTLNHIYNDPYNLIYELDGFGFRKADKLAINLGFELLDNKRIQALIMHTLFTLSESFGMSYINDNSLYNEANKVSGADLIPVDIFDKGLNHLIAKNRIIIENKKIYLKHVFNAEVEFSDAIKSINDKKNKYKESNVIEMLDSYQYSNSMKFSDEQIHAIKSSILNKVSIITGGPGTGKTTIIKAIIETFSLLNSYSILDDNAIRDIKLLAPTGKAAKRLKETCRFNAETIHRALGYDLDGNFLYHEDNLLPAKIIIIDEVSMIDLLLINNLFKAISKNTIVILVGDHNQLPSIACGDVLNDLINSKLINTFKLNKIYRQKNNSGIVNLAQMINSGSINPDVFTQNNDLHFVPCKESDINDLIVRYINIAMKQGYDLYEDITILIPMYKGICGIDNINDLVSNVYNKDFEYEFSFKEKKFKHNDKIIQLVNSKELQIYNGDIGVIDDKVLVQSEDKDKEKINVIFDNKLVKLTTSDFDNVKLAYATSIHKSQGSEYKVVIMPITKSHNIMLKRKLLYTGVTRAKEKLIMIGDYNAFINGINKIEDKRFSTLCYRLNNEKEDEGIVINNKDIPFDTLGEKNMDGITPYSFM